MVIFHVCQFDLSVRTNRLSSALGINDLAMSLSYSTSTSKPAHMLRKGREKPGEANPFVPHLYNFY